MQEIWQSLSNSLALCQQECWAQVWLTCDPGLGGRVPEGSTRARSEGSDGIGFLRRPNSSPALAQSQGEAGGAMGRQGEPGEAKGSQGEPGGRQGEPGGARGSQREPGGARGERGRGRGSQGEAGGRIGSQREPGGARGSQGGGVIFDTNMAPDIVRRFSGHLSERLAHCFGSERAKRASPY